MAIDKYLDNVTSQHRDKPKFIAWLSVTLNKSDDIYTCIKTFDDAFNIDKAVGVQQDVLGRMVGTSRILDIETDTISPVLDDETYRLVQKAKIAQNNWDGSIPRIYELWDNMFNNLKLQIIDNQDMSMTAVIFGSIKELNELLIANGYIVPKPSTVSLSYIGKSDMDFKVYSSILVGNKTRAALDMIKPPVQPIDMNFYSPIVILSNNLSTIDMIKPPIQPADMNLSPKMIMISNNSSTIKMEKSPVTNINMTRYSKMVVLSTSINTI